MATPIKLELIRYVTYNKREMYYQASTTVHIIMQIKR